MIQDEKSNSPGTERLLDELVEEITAKIQAGQCVDCEEYVRLYPQVAEQLQKMIPALMVFGEFGHSRDSDAITKSPAVDGAQGVLGDFRIVREIGRGGMGVVYEAEQISLGRPIALKVLPFAAVMDQKAITRFRNEARAAATLDHPNIVPVFSVGNERGIYYYAMSLIQGLTLAEVIRQLQQNITEQHLDESGHLSIVDIISHNSAEDVVTDSKVSQYDQTVDAKADAASQSAARRSDKDTYRDVQAAISTRRSCFEAGFFHNVVQLGVQAAEALDHAHQHGIVHRDIKPGNLMVDANSKLWITDFGLARIESDAAVTVTGDLVGTLRYMSPEQALAKRIVVDHRADIYALGVTLYELLTLRPTYDGADREKLLRQIAFEEPKPLRHYNRAVPEDLQTIVLKAIAKNPDERYNTAQDMADDLRAFQENRPINAKPPTLIQRASKWTLRHKSLVATAALILVLTTIGLAASNVLIAQQREKAEAQRQEADRQRVEAQEQRDEVGRQKRLAEENSRRARAAVDTYLTKVSEDQLLNVPSMQPLRKDLLELALNYYEEFIQQQPDDPDLQVELAVAYHRVGKITFQIGLAQEALQPHQIAHEIRERLVTLHPANLTYQQQLAISKGALAATYGNIGQLEKALDFYRDAITIQERLVKETSDALKYPFDLGRYYNNSALLHQRLGQTEEALAFYEKSIEIGESLVDRNPDRLDFFQSELATQYNNLATLCLESGQTEEALNHFKNVLTVFERLVNENPAVLRYQSNLSTAYDNLAIVQRVLGQTEEALDVCQEAITIWERLADQNPVVLVYQFNLAKSYKNLARVLTDLGRTDQILVLYQRAITILERLVDQHPERLEYQSALSSFYRNLAGLNKDVGQTEARLSNLEKAITILEKLVDENPGVLRYQIQLARSCFMAGNMHRNFGDDEAAAAVLTKVIGLGDDVGPSAALCGYVGRAHYYLGNWQQAREIMEKGIKLRGDREPTLALGPRWWYLTMTLHRLGEVEKARTYYDRLVQELEQHPPNYDSSKFLAEATEVLGIGIPPEVAEQRPTAEQPRAEPQNPESN